MVLWKVLRNISLALPEELLAEVDEAANADYTSRSEYIRQTLRAAVIARRREQAANLGLDDESRQILDDWLDINDS